MASDTARLATGGEGMTETTTGDGWAVGSLDGMGEGPGFRKVRKELGVTAFGVNAVVMPPGYASGRHMHERQQELYFVHRGTIEFTFNDGETQVLGAGGFARVDPATVRSFRNVSESEDAVYLAVGGAGGYVGRDGLVPEGESSPR
jgi:mannose-6-phosphate isomerase-like protein (cupin superfamily)